MNNYKKHIIRHRYFNNAEILLFVNDNMTNARQKNGDGRLAEIIANHLEVSTSTIYQAIYILKNASIEYLDEVLQDNISIKKAYNILKIDERQIFNNYVLDLARSEL